jgi:hypothetical protein
MVRHDYKRVQSAQVAFGLGRSDRLDKKNSNRRPSQPGWTEFGAIQVNIQIPESSSSILLRDNWQRWQSWKRTEEPPGHEHGGITRIPVGKVSAIHSAK